MEKCKLAFIGAGMIGAGLAVDALINGHPCAIYDVSDREHVVSTVRHIFDILVDAGAVAAHMTAPCLARAQFTNDLEQALSGAAFAQECVPENLELKRSIYRNIQSICGPTVIIASSTSNILPSDLQEEALYPQRILVGHPYNPSYLLPLVEVCGGSQTSDQTVAETMEIYQSMGKFPILCRKERRGLLVNELSIGVMEAAKQVVLNGVCTVEDMDRAIMYGPGLRMAVTGQILTMSLGVQGGLRAAMAKYGREPNEADRILADGVEAAIASRPPEQGNTVDGVTRYRDRLLASILKEEGLLPFATT